jgi:hypothetical protein
MKIIINERQLEKLQEVETYKKMAFKYWDKFGASINKTMLKMFGFDDRATTPVRMTYLQSWLREYLGESSAETMKKFFNKPEHKIDCGGYDFTFTIDDYRRDGHQFEIILTVDDVKGTVMLMMTDGTIHRLKDARDNEEYGWEIENEIEDCLYDYLSEKIENTTGYSFILIKLNFKSDSQ